MMTQIITGNESLSAFAASKDVHKIPMPTRIYTASTVASVDDVGYLVCMSSAGAITYTLSADGGEPFFTDQRLNVCWYGAGSTSIVPASGVTINGSGSTVTISARYSCITLEKIGANAWMRISENSSGAGAGDVTGPANSVNARIAILSGTSGKILADGGSTISDVIAAAVSASDSSVIIPTAATQAAVQAAFDTAKAASLAGATSAIEVFIPYPGEHVWSRGVLCLGADDARIPQLALRLGAGCLIKKDDVTWNSENALFQFNFVNRLHVAGEGTLDGGQPSVALGSVVNINGLAGDGIRFFSCVDTDVEGLRFQNFGDSFVRTVPTSTDTQSALSKRFTMRRVQAVKCAQFSTTNSVGELLSTTDIVIERCYFEAMNSLKVSCRASSKEVRILNNTFEGCVTDIEIDGPSVLTIKGNRHNNPTSAAIQIISNNTNSTIDYGFDNIVIDDHGVNCPTGIRLKPDSQADTVRFPCRNVDIKFRHEGGCADAGFGIALEGDFENLTAHLIGSNWLAGQPFNYVPRGSGKKNNVRLIAEGTFSNKGNTAKNLFNVLGGQMNQGQYNIDGLTLECRHVRAINMLRLYALTGFVHTAGTASGATTNAAGYAIGVKTITLASAGTGTILAGDVISFANHDGTYFVIVGDSSVANGGVLTLDVGLRTALPASAQAITVHPAPPGTAASATTDATGYAVGSTVLTLAAVGTGIIQAGDAVKFAGDTNVYTVSIGNSDVSAGGTLTLASPGLAVAMSAATKAITLMPRFFINDFNLVGQVEGGFAALGFVDPGLRCRGFFARGFKAVVDAGGGMAPTQFLGGLIDGCHIESSSIPFSLAVTNAGIRLSKNNYGFIAGVPTVPSDVQGPLMASATRTTTTVTVTVTHGLGTDFTMPTNVRRAFRFFKSDGTEIAISSMARTAATTFTATLASDPGASGNTLACFDEPIFNVLNGAAFANQIDRPYDNSGASAPLKAGTVSVA